MKEWRERESSKVKPYFWEWGKSPKNKSLFGERAEEEEEEDTMFI
jgi:hypothetical protein